MERRQMLKLAGVVAGAAMVAGMHEGTAEAMTFARLKSSVIRYSGRTDLIIGQSAVCIGVTDGPYPEQGCTLVFQEPANDTQRHRAFAALKPGDPIDPLHHRVCGTILRPGPGLPMPHVIVEIV